MVLNLAMYTVRNIDVERHIYQLQIGRKLLTLLVIQRIVLPIHYWCNNYPQRTFKYQCDRRYTTGVSVDAFLLRASTVRY